MTWKDDLKDMHYQCLDIERHPESGEPTGRVCRRWKEHTEAGNPPPWRLHYDSDQQHFWGPDLDELLDATRRKLLDHLNATVDVEAGLADLHRRVGDDPGM